MKKAIIAVLMSVLLISATFASNDKLSIGLGFSMSFLGETSTSGGVKTTAEYNQAGPSIELFGGSSGSNWAYITQIGIEFPFSASMTIGNIKGYADMSAYSLIWSWSTVFSIPYLFVNDSRIKFGIGPAFDFTLFQANSEYLSSTGFYFGAGGTATVRYFFSDNFYTSLNIHALYNFLHISFVATGSGSNTNSGLTNSWLILPSLSIGTRL